MAGLESASGDSITLNSQVMSSAAVHIPAEQCHLGIVFQDYALFPHLDVARNAAFGSERLPAKSRTHRVAEVLELMGLPNAAKRHPHELSGGQQQRVALDEPFSNLNVDLREHLAHKVRTILEAAGATALLVTHDQLETNTLLSCMTIGSYGVIRHVRPLGGFCDWRPN